MLHTIVVSLAWQLSLFAHNLLQPKPLPFLWSFRVDQPTNSFFERDSFGFDGGTLHTGDNTIFHTLPYPLSQFLFLGARFLLEGIALGRG
jgi:hypothetical protein